MKFYENVAHGVPQVLPTPGFLRNLVKSGNHHLFATWLEKLEEAALYLNDPVSYEKETKKGAFKDKQGPGPNPKQRAIQNNHDLETPYVAAWTELTDFYSKEFQPYLYYFDSIKELKALAEKPTDGFDFKNVRDQGPVYYAKDFYQYYDNEPEFQVMRNMGDTRKRLLEFDRTIQFVASKQIKNQNKKKPELQKVSKPDTRRKDSKLLVYDDVIFEPWKRKDYFSSFPRITYFNGHRGCDENLYGVLSKLHLNFNIVNPRNITRYGMSGLDARELIDSGYISKLCNASEVIIIADTVPDGRAILLSLLEPSKSKSCKSNIVIEMTNRFDWMIPDPEEYYDMLRKIFELKPKNLWWTANNPFEGPFMHSKVGSTPEVKLLRSLGAWNVDVLVDDARKDKEKSESLQTWRIEERYNASTKNSLAIIANVERAKVNRPIVGDLLDYYCMPLVKLPKKYGGPANLLKYKGFIDFPYQISVMKFYENIAFGVPQVLPTPRFLQTLVKTNNHHYFTTWMEKLEQVDLFLTDPEKYNRMESARNIKDRANREAEIKHKKQELLEAEEEQEADEIRANSPRLDRREMSDEDFDGKRENSQRRKDRLLEISTNQYKATWTELSDFYRKEFEPYVYLFDSLKELGELVNKPADEFDYKNVRVEGPKYYARVREESMAMWVQIFHEMGYTDVKQHNQ
ncbi:UNVERIFIED_CONTAM: hypothetical protein HDU68_000277 [Siphonaria sp. JEL0065]|nr:hypothetical protein HDU68_000277 [Siphonaria sp. JEL0065]